ncbi:MAG: hypothetical protein AB8B99_21935 [Phormidesmis sp.]
MAFGIVAPLLFNPYFSETAQAQTPLRVMGANTTSGNRQSYDPGEGTRIFQGLISDVVLIQEFNIGNNSDTAIQAWVESTFGPDFEYYRGSWSVNINGFIPADYSVSAVVDKCR